MNARLRARRDRGIFDAIEEFLDRRGVSVVAAGLAGIRAVANLVDHQNARSDLRSGALKRHGGQFDVGGQMQAGGGVVALGARTRTDASYCRDYDCERTAGCTKNSRTGRRALRFNDKFVASAVIATSHGIASEDRPQRRVLCQRFRGALARLEKPLLELGIRRRPGRDQRNNATAVTQMARGLVQMVDRRASARAERRVHHDHIVLVDDVVILEPRLLNSRVLVAADHCEARSQFGARLDGCDLVRLREPTRNRAMAGARLQRSLTWTDVGPLHHLEAKRLRRGEIVCAFLRLRSAVLLLGSEVERAGAVELGQRLVGGAVTLLASDALAFIAGAVVVGFLETGNERIAQRACLLTEREILGGA